MVVLRSIFLLVVLFSLAQSFDDTRVDFDLSTAVNGTVRLALFDACDFSGKPLSVDINNERFKFHAHPVKKNSYFAVVAFSYYAKPKEYTVQLSYAKNGIKRSFILGKLRIKKGDYKKETLSVSSSKVTLSKKDKLRASKEYAQAVKLYKTKTDTYKSSIKCHKLRAQVNNKNWLLN